MKTDPLLPLAAAYTGEYVSTLQWDDIAEPGEMYATTGAATGTFNHLSQAEYESVTLSVTTPAGVTLTHIFADMSVEDAWWQVAVIRVDVEFDTVPEVTQPAG